MKVRDEKVEEGVDGGVGADTFDDGEGKGNAPKLTITG